MRVITGTARGRNLLAPSGRNVRPTSAMVKEAIFSMVQFEVEGARVLDLFAGSGQMGIEALSRGARECVFVDSARESLEVLRANIASTGPWVSAKIVPSGAIEFLRGYKGQAFDIVFMDPPYDSHPLAADCLRLLAGHISGSGVVICEADAEAPPPGEVFPLRLKKGYKYGGTRVFQYRGAGEVEL